MKFLNEPLALYGFGDEDDDMDISEYKIDVPETLEFLVVSAKGNELKVVRNGSRIYTLMLTKEEIMFNFMHYYSYWKSNDLSFLEGRKIEMKLTEYLTTSDYEEKFIYAINSLKIPRIAKTGLPPTNCNEVGFSKPMEMETRIIGYKPLSINMVKIYFMYDNNNFFTDIISYQMLRDMVGEKYNYNPIHVLYYPVVINTGVYKQYVNGEAKKSEIHLTSLKFMEDDDERKSLYFSNLHYELC